MFSALTYGACCGRWWTKCPSSIPVLLCLFAVNHPRYAELIDQHAETRCPEGLFKRHRYASVFRQGVKDTLAFGRVFHMNRNIYAFGLLVTSRGRIGAH